MTERYVAAWSLADPFDIPGPRFSDGIGQATPLSIAETMAECKADGENPPTAC